MEPLYDSKYILKEVCLEPLVHTLDYGRNSIGSSYFGDVVISSGTVNAYHALFTIKNNNEVVIEERKGIYKLYVNCVEVPCGATQILHTNDKIGFSNRGTKEVINTFPQRNVFSLELVNNEKFMLKEVRPDPIIHKLKYGENRIGRDSTKNSIVIQFRQIKINFKNIHNKSMEISDLNIDSIEHLFIVRKKLFSEV